MNQMRDPPSPPGWSGSKPASASASRCTRAIAQPGARASVSAPTSRTSTATAPPGDANRLDEGNLQGRSASRRHARHHRARAALVHLAAHQIHRALRRLSHALRVRPEQERLRCDRSQRLAGQPSAAPGLGVRRLAGHSVGAPRAIPARHVRRALRAHRTARRGAITPSSSTRSAVSRLADIARTHVRIVTSARPDPMNPRASSTRTRSACTSPASPTCRLTWACKRSVVGHLASRRVHQVHGGRRRTRASKVTSSPPISPATPTSTATSVRAVLVASRRPRPRLPARP